MSYFVRLTGSFVSQIGRHLGIGSSTNQLDRQTASCAKSTEHENIDRTASLPQIYGYGGKEESCGNAPDMDNGFIERSMHVCSTPNISNGIFRFGEFTSHGSSTTIPLQSIDEVGPSEMASDYGCDPRSTNLPSGFTPSANKKPRVDRYMGGGLKRKVSSTDLNNERIMNGSSTSDYWSNEMIATLNNLPQQLQRPISAPDIPRHGSGITYTSVLKNVVIGSGNTVGDSLTSDSNLGANERNDLAKDIQERTSRFLKNQDVEGVETEAFKELTAMTKQAPRFAILYGKGSNFNARKFLKDSQDRYFKGRKCPKVYILEDPKEWRAIEENDEAIIVLMNVTGYESFEKTLFFHWKRKLNNEILPSVKQCTNLTVIVTEKAFSGMFLSGSLFKMERELRQFIINTQSNTIGEKVRRRLIWHELDRHGITACERYNRYNSDRAKCITESEITHIATKTTNLFFPQRISEYFSHFSKESLESFDKPYYRYVEIMKFLEPKYVLALLALVAFGGILLKEDIEKFRTKGYILGKNFRRSMADIHQTEIRASAIKALTQFANQHSLTVTMWDTIESGLMKMTNTFVIDQTNAYKFDGVAVEYAFLLSSTLPLDAIISFCDTWFLHNLIAPLALQNECDCVAFVGEGHTKAVKALYKRLMDEIKQRNVMLAWNHRMMSERWFCEGFLKYIKQEDGGLSQCLLMTDRREAYNALYFGLEKPFRINIEGAAKNITEMIFQHPSYKKWREKHKTYKDCKDGQEEAALHRAVELERESSVSIFLKAGVRATGDILSVAVETQNIEIFSTLLRSQKLQKEPICFESRCIALKKSLELYSKSGADARAKQIFEMLSFSASINYSSGNFEPLIIMATKKRNMTMLELLMTYYVVEESIVDKTVTPDMHYCATSSEEGKFFEGRSFEKLDVNITTKTGETALNLAITKGYYEIIAFLLQNGVNQRFTSSRSELPVMVAVRLDDGLALKLLMTYDKQVVNAQDKHGKSVLHHAVEGEKLACLDVLLSSDNLQINIVDRQNETVLHKAVAYGKDQIVPKLLRAGADIEVTDLDDNTAIDIAYKMKQFYCLEILFKAARQNQVTLNDRILFGILRTNNLRLWNMVFRYGFNVNYITRDGETPLHVAVQSRNCNLVRFLLKHGAEPNYDFQRLQYLRTSRNKKDREILNVLVEYGATSESRYTLV